MMMIPIGDGADAVSDHPAKLRITGIMTITMTQITKIQKFLIQDRS